MERLTLDPRRPETVMPHRSRLALACWLAAAAAVACLVAFPAHPTPTARQAPRASSPRGVDNLVAFTRLLGYVRYFHPSDEAAAADWEAFARAGVEAVEGAAGPGELAAVLEELFTPLAPTVQVFPSGQELPLPPALAPPQGAEAKVISWRHYGVGLGDRRGFFESFRTDLPGSPTVRYGNLLQGVDPEPLRGRRVRLTAAVRAEVAGGSQAQLWLRVDRPGGEQGFFDNMHDRPIRSPRWATYEIEGEVAADATAVLVGLILLGEGRAYLDDVALEVLDGPSPPHPLLVNGGLEDGEIGQPPREWINPRRAAREGYTARLSEEQPYQGEHCVQLSRDALPAPPDPSGPYETELGGGVTARIPLGVWADRTGTLPAARAATPPEPISEPSPGAATDDDRSTRLAAVALAWNIPQHFHPFLEEGDASWQAALPPALRAAATDPDADAFHTTLRRLIAHLDDGGASVAHPADPRSHRLPLRWEWIGERLLVTHVEPAMAGVLAPGDEVTAIDGRPAAAALAAAEALISASTPQWRRLHALEELTRGPAGEAARLTLRRGTGGEGSLSAPYSLPAEAGSTFTENRPPVVDEVAPGIFYADLTRLEEDAVAAAAQRLQPARGLILDLRGGLTRGGHLFFLHLLDRPARLPEFLFPLTTRPDRHGRTWQSTLTWLHPRSPRLTAPRAFLADGSSAGASETRLDMVRRYRLGTIVGTASAGRNGQLNPFTIPGGFTVYWTGMLTVLPDGSLTHHRTGFEPDVPVARTRQGVAAGRDEILQRAIELLGGGG